MNCTTMIIYAAIFAQLFSIPELSASHTFTQEEQKAWHESMLQDIYTKHQPSENEILSFKNKIDAAKSAGFFFNDVNQKIQPQDAGTSILLCCIQHNKSAYTRALLEAGADPNIRNESMGRSPLHFAAQNYHHEMITILISYGANVNIPDANGLTPLYFAENEYKDDRYAPRDRTQIPACIQTLQDAGATPVDYTTLRRYNPFVTKHS